MTQRKKEEESLDHHQQQQQQVHQERQEQRHSSVRGRAGCCMVPCLVAHRVPQSPWSWTGRASKGSQGVATGTDTLCRLLRASAWRSAWVDVRWNGGKSGGQEEARASRPCGDLV